MHRSWRIRRLATWHSSYLGSYANIYMSYICYSITIIVHFAYICQAGIGSIYIYCIELSTCLQDSLKAPRPALEKGGWYQKEALEAYDIFFSTTHYYFIAGMQVSKVANRNKQNKTLEQLVLRKTSKYAADEIYLLCPQKKRREHPTLPSFTMVTLFGGGVNPMMKQSKTKSSETELGLFLAEQSPVDADDAYNTPPP